MRPKQKDPCPPGPADFSGAAVATGIERHRLARDFVEGGNEVLGNTPRCHVPSPHWSCCAATAELVQALGEGEPLPGATPSRSARAATQQHGCGLPIASR